MKKILTFIFLLSFIFNAQYVELAPWQVTRNKNLSTQELDSNFETCIIEIYSNPNNGIFTIYSHFYNPESIIILDISGKKLQTFDNQNNKYNSVVMCHFMRQRTNDKYFRKKT